MIRNELNIDCSNFSQKVDSRRIQQFLKKNALSIEKMPQGMTNINYKCVLRDGKKYVVRFPGAGSEYLVDRDDESDIIQNIKPLGIDVDTIFFDAESGVKITEYQENCTSLIGDKNHIIRIGVEILKRLHSSGIVFKKRFDFWQYIAEYIKTCDKYGVSINKSLYQMLHRLNEYKDIFLMDQAIRFPCHNDPVSENFLVKKSGETFLIDWEYGGMNDLVWDLAAFSLENGLNPIEEEKFLAIYYRQSYDITSIRSKMLIYKIYQDFLWYLWSEIKQFFGQNIADYAAMRYRRGKENFDYLVIQA